MRRVILGVAAVALMAAACSTTDQVVVLPDYAAQVAGLPTPPNDRSLPDVSPDDPLGASGAPGPLPAARARVLVRRAPGDLQRGRRNPRLPRNGPRHIR